jgi:hypothetical protein
VFYGALVALSYFYMVASWGGCVWLALDRASVRLTSLGGPQLRLCHQHHSAARRSARRRALKRIALRHGFFITCTLVSFRVRDSSVDTARDLHIAYTAFYVLATLLSMQVRDTPFRRLASRRLVVNASSSQVFFVGFRVIETSDHLAMHGVFGFMLVQKNRSMKSLTLS